MSQHTYMQKEGKDGKLGGPVVRIATVDWARYRQDGYGFCEKTDDFDPHAEWCKQNADAAKDAAEGRASDDVTRRAREPGSGTHETDDDDDGVSMENTKAEILAYMDSQGIDADETFTKAELLELLEA